jgi:AP-1 complex subunit gamma-1
VCAVLSHAPLPPLLTFSSCFIAGVALVAAVVDIEPS